MFQKLKKNFRLLQQLWALRKAATAAAPGVKVELAVWRSVGNHLWAEIELKANDADGLTLEEVVALVTHFIEHDLPALLGPPSGPEPPFGEWGDVNV